MNKEHLHIKIKTNTKEKLEYLKEESGLSVGQLIDLMTKKQKLSSLIK